MSGASVVVIDLVMKRVLRVELFLPHIGELKDNSSNILDLKGDDGDSLDARVDSTTDITDSVLTFSLNDIESNFQEGVD